MINQFVEQYGSQIIAFQYLLILVNAILHLLFAGAVAKDGGHLHRIGQKTALVSASTWAFATLLGGVFIAAIYWFIHHSTFTVPNTISRNNHV